MASVKSMGIKYSYGILADGQLRGKKMCRIIRLEVDNKLMLHNCIGSYIMTILTTLHTKNDKHYSQTLLTTCMTIFTSILAYFPPGYKVYHCKVVVVLELEAPKSHIKSIINVHIYIIEYYLCS